jgi:hypothetical protein
MSIRCETALPNSGADCASSDEPRDFIRGMCIAPACTFVAELTATMMDLVATDGTASGIVCPKFQQRLRNSDPPCSGLAVSTQLRSRVTWPQFGHVDPAQRMYNVACESRCICLVQASASLPRRTQKLENTAVYAVCRFWRNGRQIDSDPLASIPNGHRRARPGAIYWRVSPCGIDRRRPDQLGVSLGAAKITL